MRSGPWRRFPSEQEPCKISRAHARMNSGEPVPPFKKLGWRLSARQTQRHLCDARSRLGSFVSSALGESLLAHAIGNLIWEAHLGISLGSSRGCYLNRSGDALARRLFRSLSLSLSLLFSSLLRGNVSCQCSGNAKCITARSVTDLFHPNPHKDHPIPTTWDHPIPTTWDHPIPTTCHPIPTTCHPIPTTARRAARAAALQS